MTLHVYDKMLLHIRSYNFMTLCYPLHNSDATLYFLSSTSIKAYVVTPPTNGLSETILMRGHSIHFHSYTSLHQCSSLEEVTEII